MKIIKQAWELLWVIVLGAPMIVVGYFGTFIVNGVVTGYLLYQKLRRSDETLP